MLSVWVVVGEDEGVASWMLSSVLAEDEESLFGTGVLFTEFWSPSCRPGPMPDELHSSGAWAGSNTIFTTAS